RGGGADRGAGAVGAPRRGREGKRVVASARRSWLGFAEEHFVDLDFGDQLAKLKPGERLYLVLAGWTDYPYPESIYAAEQAGVPGLGPVLERPGPDGKWRAGCELGLPAGAPRGVTGGPTRVLSGGAAEAPAPHDKPARRRR